MPKKYGESRGRIGRASASSLSAAELRTIVRRLGFVAHKAHEAAMSNLLRNSDSNLAELFNDAFKPVVDYLLHFELEGVRFTGDEEETDDGEV